jgi:hypothetical protein
MTYGDSEASTYEEGPARRARPQPGTPPRDALGGRQKRLWEAAETLDNALDTLTHRIAPVLLPERVEGALAGIDGDAADSSALSGFLDQLRERLERLGHRVSETSERVDL